MITVPLGGEHFLRRPSLGVRARGFAVERAERFKVGLVERLVARKACRRVIAREGMPDAAGR